MGGILIPVDIKEVVWVVVWEGIVIVIGELDGEGLTFWVGITLGAEEMSRIEVSVDETFNVVVLSDDGETAEVFLVMGDDTELNEGIWNGIFKIGGTIDEGMGISIEIGVINSGRQVAYW